MHGRSFVTVRLVALAFLCFVSATLAGTETITAPPSFASAAGAIFAVRAFSLAVYPSYDPYIKVGGVNKPFGFGASLLYPVSEYAFAGLRVDFLGEHFWAPSAVVGAKYTLPRVRFSPTVFTVGGLILPVSGAGAQTGVAGATTGVGITFVLFHNGANTLSVNGFFAGEKWSQFDGIISHLGFAVGAKF